MCNINMFMLRKGSSLYSGEPNVTHGQPCVSTYHKKILLTCYYKIKVLTETGSAVATTGS